MSEVTDNGKISDVDKTTKPPKKNIIICSDGTGNRGGLGPETNVYRIYTAINIHNPERRQIKFYDDGVGTGGNKIWKLLGGAFGLGLDRNIIQAYTFLCRNFDKGDDIYLFGFSRGAYTVRALASFITYCGVLKGIKESDGKSQTSLKIVEELDDESLNSEIDRLVKLYVQRPAKDGKGRKVDEAKGAPKIDGGKFVKHKSEMERLFALTTTNITFIGVWDTVSAVGLPFENNIKRWIAKHVFKFHFEDFDLPPDVDRACHALAIDDQRKTFHPELWNKDKRVEQVWFSGMHSNVGGGYPKQGMAHVSLSWMISKVKSKNDFGDDGLLFIENSVAGYKDKANPLGKMYDSRSGLAAYYRYEPRFFYEMENLEEVKLHFSVVERITHQTADYNPGNFALRLDGENRQELKIVNAPNDEWASPIVTKVEKDIGKISMPLKKRYARVISFQQEALHLAFVQFSLLLLVALLSGYIALNTEGLSPSEITACIKKYAVIFSIVYAAIMVITFFHTRNWIKKLLCAFTPLLPFGVMFFPEGEMFENPGRTFESLLGVVPLIDGVLKTILGVVSWLVAILLPDFLMNPIDYFIENNAAIISIAIVIFVFLMLIRKKLSRKAKKIVFDAWKDARRVLPSGPRLRS